MQTVIAHGFDCSPAAFWGLFLSPDFSRAFWVEKTGASRYESLRDETTPSGDRRRAFKVVLGGLELPGPIAKLLGGPLGFTEEGTFDKERGQYTYLHTYSALTERIKVRGAISLRPAADARSITRVAVVDIDIKIFGLGALAERAAESNFKWGFQAEAEFGAAWIKTHALAG